MTGMKNSNMLRDVIQILKQQKKRHDTTKESEIWDRFRRLFLIEESRRIVSKHVSLDLILASSLTTAKSYRPKLH